VDAGKAWPLDTFVKPIVLDRFDDASRKVLAAANEEACRLGHEYLGTEHVLLALAEGADGTVAKELPNLGVEAGRLRQEAEKLWRVALNPLPDATLPMTPRVKRALREAVAEADRQAHNHASPVDRLRGLLNDPYGLATQLVLLAQNAPNR
jgi:ATP-dependent Clp protease ATP-binding subunit ClpC